MMYLREIVASSHYFDKGYFLAGNEPGCSNALGFHYAGRPDLSALRVRRVVFEHLHTGIGGVRPLSPPSPSLSLSLSPSLSTSTD